MVKNVFNENEIMNFKSFIPFNFYTYEYLRIKPLKSFNVHKTDGTLSYFKMKLNRIGEMNEILLIFHF